MAESPSKFAVDAEKRDCYASAILVHQVLRTTLKWGGALSPTAKRSDALVRVHVDLVDGGVAIFRAGIDRTDDDLDPFGGDRLV